MLTERQYKVLQFFEHGADFGQDFSEWETEKGRIVGDFLHKKNYIVSDVRFGRDYFCLTSEGESALAEYREAIAQRRQQQAEKEAAEAKRLEERAQDRADQERRYRGQNKISIIVPAITFVLGMVTEHFSGIVRFITHIASNLLSK